jgi:hypothetical protein
MLVLLVSVLMLVWGCTSLLLLGCESEMTSPVFDEYLMLRALDLNLHIFHQVSNLLLGTFYPNVFLNLKLTTYKTISD